MKITIQHVRETHFCSAGARRFFAKHNLDWAEFIKHGIDEEILVKTGDSMALQVIAKAKEGQEEAK